MILISPLVPTRNLVWMNSSLFLNALSKVRIKKTRKIRSNLSFHKSKIKIPCLLSQSPSQMNLFHNKKTQNNLVIKSKINLRLSHLFRILILRPWFIPYQNRAPNHQTLRRKRTLVKCLLLNKPNHLSKQHQNKAKSRNQFRISHQIKLKSRMCKRAPDLILQNLNWFQMQVSPNEGRNNQNLNCLIMLVKLKVR